MKNPGRVTYSFNKSSKQTFRVDLEKSGLGTLRVKTDVPALISSAQPPEKRHSNPAVVQGSPLVSAYAQRRTSSLLSGTEHHSNRYLAVKAAYKIIQSPQVNGTQQERNTFLVSLASIKRIPEGSEPDALFPHKLSELSLGLAINRERDQQCCLFYSHKWVSTQRGKITVRASLEPKEHRSGIHVQWENKLKCGLQPTVYMQAYPLINRCYMGFQVKVWKRASLLDFLTPGSVGKALGESSIVNFV